MKPYFALMTIFFAVGFLVEAKQPHPPHTERCGPQHFEQRCSEGLCCSTYGDCGTGPEFCAAGNCQPDYGICWDSPPSPSPPPPPPPSPPPPPPSPSPPPPSPSPPPPSPSPPPPSPPPPPNPERCGPQHFDKRCGEGLCCSTYGDCGTGPEFCAIGNCQPDYGICWDSPPPPSPPPPSPTPSPPPPSPSPPPPSPSPPPPSPSPPPPSPSPPPPSTPPPPPPLSPSPPPPPSHGHCGPAHFEKRCKDGFCCNVYGECGNTAEYCSYLNCQPDYGTCWGPTPPPAPSPSPTSSIGDQHVFIRKVFDYVQLLGGF